MPDHLQKYETYMLLKFWWNLFLWYLPCELYIVNRYDSWDMGQLYFERMNLRKQINKQAIFLFVNIISEILSQECCSIYLFSLFYLILQE